MEFINHDFSKDKSIKHIKETIKVISSKYQSTLSDTEKGDILNNFENLSIYSKRRNKKNSCDEDIEECVNIDQSGEINSEDYKKLFVSTIILLVVYSL